MRNRYYHGLAGSIPSWEEQAVLDESLRTLNLIFELGGLHCRNNLKQYRIEMYDETESLYNGADYISICIGNPIDDEFTGEDSDLNYSFIRYAKTKIAIEFKSSIVDTCVFREELYKKLPGESQIYKFIDISNFNRILVGLKNLNTEAMYEISKICEPYDIPVMTFKETETLEDNNQKKLCK